MSSDEPSRGTTLRKNRRIIIDYLYILVAEEDWHGVMDAAADLREIDAELKGLKG